MSCQLCSPNSAYTSYTVPLLVSSYCAETHNYYTRLASSYGTYSWYGLYLGQSGVTSTGTASSAANETPAILCRHEGKTLMAHRLQLVGKRARLTDLHDVDVSLFSGGVVHDSMTTDEYSTAL
jgi:hypothetical protein